MATEQEIRHIETSIEDRILRLPQVLERVGLGATSVWRAVSEGKFPKPLRIYGRSVGWRASDIAEFIRSRELAAMREA